MKHLFIGGGGLVGSAAVQLAQKRALAWQATSRQTLDLAHQPFTNLPNLLRADVVYLIAAVRSPTDCDERPKETWPINADAPIALARHYSIQGAFVVFVSSDAAEKGIGHYATQKRQAESFMQHIDAAILRPGKLNSQNVDQFVEFMIMFGLRREARTYRFLDAQLL